MWQYEKKLQYPVKIANPNPALAKVIISQLGGPDGELGAALRYLNQRYSAPCREVQANIIVDREINIPIGHFALVKIKFHIEFDLFRLVFS